MDPLRIAVRVVFVYFFVLALMRVSGKRTVKQSDLASFVVAVVIGDMFDDALWAEVPMSEFVIGAGAIVLVHLLVRIDSFHRGLRRWRRGVSAGQGAG